eukprot:12936476-Prorocentrum_lima.AAC.1
MMTAKKQAAQKASPATDNAMHWTKAIGSVFADCTQRGRRALRATPRPELGDETTRLMFDLAAPPTEL